MTRTEHLLCILAEECAEVAHRVSKALRFTLAEVQPGQDLTNAQMIVQELNDLKAVVTLLADDGIIQIGDDAIAIHAKREKVERFLRYSEERGTLT